MSEKKGNTDNEQSELANLDKKLNSAELVHGTDQKQANLEEVLRKMLPHVGSDLNKLVLTQVMIILKLENVIDESVSSEDSKQMIKVIKDSIMNDPDKRHQTLRLIQKLLK
jgi:hypothetical protein